MAIDAEVTVTMDVEAGSPDEASVFAYAHLDTAELLVLDDHTSAVIVGSAQAEVDRLGDFSVVRL